jgi:hypothetical protein
MPQQSKAAERSTLILQLGRLLAPISELAERPTPPTSADYRLAAAAFRPDVDQWNNGSVGPFVCVGATDSGMSTMTSFATFISWPERWLPLLVTPELRQKYRYSARTG